MIFRRSAHVILGLMILGSMVFGAGKVDFFPEPKPASVQMQRQKTSYNATEEETKAYDVVNELINNNKGFENELNAFVKKYPQSPNGERLFYNAAYRTYYNEYNKDKGKVAAWCKKYMERYPDGDNIETIASYYNYALEITLEVYAYTAFTPAQDVSVNINARNTGVVDVEIYRIPPDDVKTPLNEIDPFSFPLTKERQVRKMQYQPSRKDYYGSVPLGKLDAGLYAVAVRAKDAMSATIVSVSRLGVISKGDLSHGILFAVDKITGEPVSGAKVRVFTSGLYAGQGTSDQNGLVLVDRRRDGEHFSCIVSKENDIAFVDVSGGYRDNTGLKTYFYADRPIYRPEQTVQFKIILREQQSSMEYALPKDTVYKVVIETPGSKKVFEKELTMNEFGTIADAVSLPKGAELGWYRYRLYLTNGTELGNRYGYYYRGRGRYNSGYGDTQAFRVEEYKKPEFKMTIAPVRASYVKGDTIEVNVGVQYYFGQPVTKGEIEYRVNISERYVPYWYRYPFAWYYYDDEYGYNRGRNGQLYKTGKVETDAKGNCVISFPAKDLPYDADYSVEVRVTDASRRMIEGSATVKVAQAAFAISLTTDKYMYKSGETILVNFDGSDINGKPVAFEGMVSVRRQDWSKDHEENEDLGKEKVKTEASGKGIYRFQPKKNGNYYFSFTAKDANGREVKAERSVYVADYSWHSFFNYSGVNVVFNKDSYEPGDSGTAMIQSPYASAYALITHEGEKLIDYRVVKLASSVGVVDFSVRDEHAPNFYYSVTMVRDNSIATKVLPVVVPPKKKFITVTITPDKEVYRPGETATFRIKTADGRGRAVDSEISIGLVDASLYYLQEEFVKDMRQSFYGKINNRVYTGNSFYAYHYGRRRSVSASKSAMGGSVRDEERSVAREMAAPSAAKKKDKNGSDDDSGGAPEKEPELREYFPDTAFWSPFVRTGANGMAVVAIKMPDTLTTWRTTVRAITKETAVGSGTKENITFKNLLCRLEVPRFITQDDTMIISGIAHNYLSGAKSVRGVLAADGVTLLGDPSQKVNIAPGGEYRYDWRITADKPGRAAFTLKTLTDEESDAMKLTIPVLAHGLERNDVQSFMLKAQSETVTKQMVFPASAIKETYELSISAGGSVSASMLDALPYLIGYPYGCVEQTMSRFLPDVIVGRTITKLKLPSPAILSNLPDMVDKGLARLYELQHGDGGWGWWNNDETHAYMTAYVMYGFSLTRAQYPVRSDVYDRGMRALIHLYEREKPGDTKAYMAHSIACLPQPDKKLIIKLYDDSKGLTTYARALLAMALMKVGERDRAGKLIALIKAKAAETESSCSFSGEGFYYSWQRNDLEVTTHVLHALAMYDPDDAMVPKIINWIMVRKQGNYWVSTKDTAKVVYAFAEYLERTGELAADYWYSVALNGNPVMQGNISAKSLHADKISVTISAEKLLPGSNSITVTKSGTGRLYLSCAAKYFNYEKVIAPTSKNIQIERSYQAVKITKDEQGTVLREERTPIIQGVTSGDEIEVTLTVSSPNTLEYIMIEDYIPAGCEIINRKSGRNWWSHEEFRDEKAVFFLTRFSGEKHIIQYRLRAEIPGTYESLPAVAVSMYFPDVYANTKSDRVSIREKVKRE
ncbi:MAG: hypothetical protein HZC28_15315 [Spirochaetes bacterium]|nr:hypothetical protein [Spirochaetota bacterium]